MNRKHSKPSQPLPPNSADCHLHVFGPYRRFPLAAERAYNVPEAPLAAHEQLKKTVGLERTVLVQASGYGTDNRAMLAALSELGPRGRGVAVIDPDSANALLKDLHDHGVKGLRLNLQTFKEKYAGNEGEWVERFEKVAVKMGWHLQFFGEGSMVEKLEPVFSRMKTTIVVDHMGLPDARQGIGQPGFQALLRLLKRDNIWVKLAGADRVTRHTGRLKDAIPFVRALVDAAPDRLVWGTDWPNIGFHAGKAIGGEHEVLPYRQLDAGALLEVLIEAVPDPRVREKILARNPERLYGF
jgi:predicted TIM-barrel fold metal-dependent hydrolase